MYTHVDIGQNCAQTETSSLRSGGPLALESEAHSHQWLPEEEGVERAGLQWNRKL
jgi:hypothetical protein